MSPLTLLGTNVPAVIIFIVSSSSITSSYNFQVVRSSLLLESRECCSIHVQIFCVSVVSRYFMAKISAPNIIIYVALCIRYS